MLNSCFILLLDADQKLVVEEESFEFNRLRDGELVEFLEDGGDVVMGQVSRRAVEFSMYGSLLRSLEQSCCCSSEFWK